MASSSRKWAILITVTLISFITNVDGTIVIIGLPRVMNGLHINIVAGLWIITSYLITSTLFLLPAGRFADVIGEKRIFLWGLAIFTVATALCGFANSGTMLIVYRFLQGTGAAFALATATPIIVRAFPQNQLGRALGVNATSWVIGSIVGPVVGGTLISLYGWRSIFFVTVPFALIGIIAASIVLQSSGNRLPAKTDWLGTATFGLGLTALLVALSEGQSWGFSSVPILTLFGTTLILWLAFVITEMKIKHPLFNLSLLSHAHYRIGLCITLVYCIGYFSITFLMTIYLQGALALSPLYAALLLIPLSLPQLFLGPVGGSLADRFGSTRIMLLGLPFVTLGIILLTILRSRLSIVGIVVPLFIVSAANSMVWPSLSKAVFAAAPREQTGSASGMFYTIRNIGMSLSQTLALVAAEFTVSPAVASDAFLGTSGSRNISLARALTHATDNGFLFFVAFFVIAIIFTFFLLRPQQHMTSTLHTEPATIVHETP